MREGLALVLERGGCEIVGVANDAADVVRKTIAHRPDLLIADIRMPPSHADDGLQAALEVRRRVPGLPVLVLSQHLQRHYAVELLESGTQGVGYLLKQRIADIKRFLADIRRIVAGGTVLDRDVVSAMLDRPRDDDPLGGLTARQTEVLELMAQGRSNAAIAEQHGLRKGGGGARVSDLRRARTRQQTRRPPPRARGCPLPRPLTQARAWRPRRLPGRRGRTGAACLPRAAAPARPPGAPAGAWTPPAGSSPAPGPTRSPAAHPPAAAPGSPGAAVGDRVEDVRRRRCSCHGAIICRYRHASRRGISPGRRLSSDSEPSRLRRCRDEHVALALRERAVALRASSPSWEWP